MRQKKKNVSSSKLFILQDTTQCLFLCPVNFMLYTQNKRDKKNPPLLFVSSDQHCTFDDTGTLLTLVEYISIDF